jgi:hypothetical protein
MPKGTFQSEYNLGTLQLYQFYATSNANRSWPFVATKHCLSVIALNQSFEAFLNILFRQGHGRDNGIGSPVVVRIVAQDGTRNRCRQGEWQRRRSKMVPMRIDAYKISRIATSDPGEQALRVVYSDEGIDKGKRNGTE